MARKNHGMEQCPKCSTWRKWNELVTHINICTGFRCPFCGMAGHNGHKCIHGTVYRDTTDNSITLIRYDT